MCKLRRKLLMFDYMIGKFVEWENDNKALSELSQDEINNSLTKMTGVRSMKLLYFVCLSSIVKKINKDEIDKEEFDFENDNLFNLYNNFVAMPRGPVEDDVYSNRSMLLRFKFENGFWAVADKFDEYIPFTYPKVTMEHFNGVSGIKTLILDEEMQRHENNRDSEVPLINIKSIIDSGIDYLKEIIDKFPFDDSDKLVNMTHSLPLWNDYFRNEEKKYALTKSELVREAKTFMNF